MSMKPIYIVEGGGSKPVILNAIDMDNSNSNSNRALSAVYSQRVNNVSALEITLLGKGEPAKAITNTSDLWMFDQNGNLQEFHIVSIEDYDSTNYTRVVYAESSLAELVDNVVRNDSVMPTTTNPADYLNYILGYTRWSVGTVDSGIYNSKWTEDLTGMNCLEALQAFVDKYNCEFEVRYTFDGKNKITGRYIDLKKQIGSNNYKRFEDDKDLLDLKRQIDFSSIKTAIYPRIVKEYTDEAGNSVTEYTDISSVAWSKAAGHPCDKPLGQTVLINPDASALLKRLDTKSGNLHNRIMYAEWTDSTCADAEDLIKQAWSILKMNTVITPTIEVKAVDLYRLSGNDNSFIYEMVSLGDNCIIIDRAFSPVLRLETRVMELTQDLLNPANTEIVFGSCRRTLATSDLESKKTVEEQLQALKDKVQGVIATTNPNLFQSGKDYYTGIKETVQNEFLASSGYIMIDDSDGLWVFDKPLTETPTKATIVKGGCIAIAEYDSTTGTWEVGSFTNGLSVNADYINTGHISANCIAAGSITAEHLSIAAQEYLKTGLATDDDLQAVINDINSIQNDYVTSQALSNALDEFAGGTLSLSDIKMIQDTQRQLKVEYDSVYAQAKKVYGDTYLPAGTQAKVNLNSKMTAYTTAYNTYNNQITSMIADGVIEDSEYETYKSKCTAYGTALKELLQAIEDANSARLANVYALAREGLVTEASLEVNNQSVIATARQGMVSTGSLTESISMAKADMADEMNSKISEATADLTTTEELNTAIVEAKIPAYENSLAAITTEYNNNIKQATILYGNGYLTGTAKTNLNNAMTAYTDTYTDLETAINNIVSDVSLDTAHVNAYNNALTNFQSATTSLGQAMTQASNSITSEIMASSKRYTDTKTSELDAELSDVQNALTDLDSTMTGAFRDGIISEAEALAIASNLDLLTSEKADIDKEKDTLYTNPLLSGTAKTELNSAKVDYNTAHTNLVNAIKNAISDSKVTASEKNDIKGKYTAYSTALSNYRIAAQNAIDYIAEAKSKEAIYGLEIGGTNLLLNSDNGYLNNLSVYNAPPGLSYSNTDGWRCITIGDNQLAQHEIVQEKWYTPDKLGHYTFSIYCKTDATSLSCKISAYSNNVHNLLDTKIIKVGDDLYRIYGTWEVTALNKIRIVDLRNFTTVGATYLNFRYPMLEYGMVVSDWSANPSDILTIANNYSDTAISNAVEDLPTMSDVESAENNAVVASKIETIKQTYSTITLEYSNNIQQVNTVLDNTYLSSTALTNLTNAKSDYVTGFNNITTAYNDIVNKNTLTTTQLNTWNTALTNFKTLTTKLSQRVNEALNFINTAVYNASKDYTDKAIPDALTGYAKTSYVDDAMNSAVASAKEGMVSETQLQVNNTEILMTASSMGQYNLLRNTDFRDELNYWTTRGTGNDKSVHVLKETQSYYSGCMSGEKNLGIVLNNQTPGSAAFIGAYQDTTACLSGVTYTVGYWVNCQQADINVSVSNVKVEDEVGATEIIDTLAIKTYSNINGTKDRSTWKYDSITFTVPSTTSCIRFSFSIAKVNNTWARAFLVKPMLVNGINAQAWTANPAEIHVGVVSVTEERGIMVEHSDTNTYTTLDSTGLFVWDEGQDIPIASFGADGSATIGTIACDQIISDQHIPVATVDEYIVIHCSAAGSGNYSGVNSSNNAAGFTGAMEILCNKLGIDSTHTRGNFMVNGTNQVDIYFHGTDVYSDIILENVYGSFTLRIIFDSSVVLKGVIQLYNVNCNCIIEGNKTSIDTDGGAVIKTTETGIVAKGCSSLAITGIRVFNTGDAGTLNGIVIDNGSRARLENVDVNGYHTCIYAGGQSYISVYNCRGTGTTFGTRLNTGTFALFRGYVPRKNGGGEDNIRYDLGSNGMNLDVASRDSLMTTMSSPINKTVKTVYTPVKYKSIRKYWVSDPIQGSWNDSDEYGNFECNVYLSTGTINMIKKGTNVSASIYLERKSTAHGNSTADICINGESVGTLNRGSGAWFTIPASQIQAIKNGDTAIKINGGGNACYCKFARNMKIRITATVSL